MKKTMIYLLILLMSLSCKSEMHKASFQFKGIKKYEDKLLLTLSSKHDIFEMYEKEDAVNIYLTCPLDGDIEKETWDWNYELEGTPDKVSFFDKKTGRYFYKFQVSFITRDGNLLPQKEVNSLLQKKDDCLECKMILAHYFTKFSGQFSQLFCIPNKFIRNELIE